MKKHFFSLSLVLGLIEFSGQTLAQTAPSPSVIQTPSLPSPPTVASQEKHLWNLQDVDILKVIAEVSRETGKNFIVDPQVTGKITIVSSEALSSDAVYPLFLSALQILGYGTVQSGDLIKIIPLKDAVQNGVISHGKFPPAGDALIVKVITLKNVSAVQLSPSLTPLMPTWANVTAYAPSNSLIVSGSVSVVKRMEDIVRSVDTPFANGVDIIRLNYADAAEVVKSIEKLEQGHRFSTGDYGSSVSADVRTNSIMLGGSDATRLHYKVLIAQLDVANTQNSPTDTQVFNLKFNSVTAMLPVLRSSVHQTVNVNVIDSSVGASSSGGGYSSSSAAGVGGGSSSPTANRIPEVTNASLNAGASNASDQSGVTIVGDVPNNALIITAPPNIMRTLKAVIQQLDIRPKQILVQGIIAEVDADIFSRLGVQWSTGPAGDTSTFAAGLGLGFIHKGSLTALVTALSGDNNTNILSTPSITVLNNGNASITVGSSVSVITNALTQPAANTSTTSVVTNSYNYKDVGLTLNVVPQITSDDSVNMKISQSNSTLLSKAASAGIVNGNTNPDMNTQSLSTTILVKNEDILVLGGLTQNKEEVHVTKIPILSAIPLLGKLFQYEEKRMVKKDLLIFLRPMILNNAQDGTLVTNNKYNMMRNTAVATLHGNTLKDTSILPDPIHQVLPEPFS